MHVGVAVEVVVEVLLRVVEEYMIPKSLSISNEEMELS